jgi:hypothetical protein
LLNNTSSLINWYFGFDFNPTDRIRLVSNTGQNLRLHPDLGTVVAIDGNLNPGTHSTMLMSSVAGATTTTLFVIDSQTDDVPSRSTKCWNSSDW